MSARCVSWGQRYDHAEWVVGTVLDVAADPALQKRYDLATMTANVAQVFLDDDEWLSTLRAIHACLRKDGHLAFEARSSGAVDHLCARSNQRNSSEGSFRR